VCARKYERTEGRKDTRAGSYDRRLQAKAGEVTLTVPKLRTLPFEAAIIFLCAQLKICHGASGCTDTQLWRLSPAHPAK